MLHIPLSLSCGVFGGRAGHWLALLLLGLEGHLLHGLPAAAYDARGLGIDAADEGRRLACAELGRRARWRLRVAHLHWGLDWHWGLHWRGVGSVDSGLDCWLYRLLLM